MFDAELREGRGGFLSAKHRNKLLDHVNKSYRAEPGARLWRVRSVGQVQSFKSVDEILGVLNSDAGNSVYIRGGLAGGRRVEGVYLRADDDAKGLLCARAKLVHPDFHRMLALGRWEGGARNCVRTDLWWGRDDDGNEERDG